jgi:hypothetical protein
MKMNMFTALDKTKPETENIGGLNLAVVKLMTVQVTKLPLWHKTRKIGTICFGKPVLIRGLVYCAKARLFNNLLYVRHVYVTKAKPIHKRRTQPLVRGDVTYSLRPQGFSWEKISGRKPQGAWRQDDPTGGSSRKVTLPLTLTRLQSVG